MKIHLIMTVCIMGLLAVIVAFILVRDLSRHEYHGKVFDCTTAEPV